MDTSETAKVGKREYKVITRHNPNPPVPELAAVLLYDLAGSKLKSDYINDVIKRAMQLERK